MKATIALLATSLCFTGLVQAQQLSMSSQTFQGGGGNCVGGAGTGGRSKFSLVATTGQPDAWTCANSGYVLQGGFLPAFQKPIGPPMRIERLPSGFNVYWPMGCGGFVLEATNSFPYQPDSNWPKVSGNPASAGNEYQLTVPSDSAHRFFRLHKDCPANCASKCPQ